MPHRLVSSLVLLGTLLLTTAAMADDAIPPASGDSDHDGLPDTFEQRTGRNPQQADYVALAGYRLSCALDDKGLLCWGDKSRLPPSAAKPLAVSLGSNHGCYLVADSTGKSGQDTSVSCWGDDTYGKATAPLLNKPTAIAAGQLHSCAIDTKGVRCWGDNSRKQLDAPQKLKKPRALVAGGLHSCVLDNEGVQCWGDNWAGQLAVPALKNPRQISAGHQHSCALDDEGVKCWGDSYFDEAAYGKSGKAADSYPARTVPSLKSPRMVSAGFDHSCALDDEGVQCWGENDHGQLTPPPELLKPPIAAVSAGTYHSCALDADGVKCWGDNRQQQTEVLELFFDADRDGLALTDDKHPLDFDNDGIADTEDDDNDNDSVVDSADNCSHTANTDQQDSDGDKQGNACDDDDDNDSVPDRDDALPLDRKESVDTDGDGTGNNSDKDDDNDGVEDRKDAFPLDARETLDTDKDGNGNNADSDDDNDGVDDSADAFPLDSKERVDTDKDGRGDNSDKDDDNDGVSDKKDKAPLDASIK